jgi:hypothetical protein
MRRSRRRRGRGESGQTTAFVLTLLMAFVLIVAMVVNVGQALNRRIALQVVADAGAYTGASVMATGMNHLAYWNRQIQRTWGMLSFVSAHFQRYKLGPFPTCEFYSNWFFVLQYYRAHTHYLAAYANFSSLLSRRPEEVSDANVRHLFPGEKLTYSETAPPSQETGVLLPGRVPAVIVAPGFARNGTTPVTASHDWAVETDYDVFPFFDTRGNFFSRFLVADLEDSWNLKTWTCWQYIPPIEVIISPVFFYVTPWYRLEDIGVFPPYHFVWIVRAKPTRARMFDQFFGPNAVPAMTAVAVAKPLGGDILKGESKYRAKMVPVARVAPGGVAVVRDSYYDRPARPVLH